MLTIRTYVPTQQDARSVYSRTALIQNLKIKIIEFNSSPNPTIGVEIELQLIDNVTLDLKNISPKDIDLQNHYAANQGKFKLKDAKEPLPFEKDKAQVERYYKQLALSTAIQEMLAQEVASKGVELFMEALND